MNVIDYFIDNLHNYPKDGNHLGIFLSVDIPIRISYGQDRFFYRDKNDKEVFNHPKRWIVLPADWAESSFNSFFSDDKIRQFKDPDKAVHYGVSLYFRWLKERQKEIKTKINKKKANSHGL